MSANVQLNKVNGRSYRYHPRSDAHSKAICRFVVDDLLAMCPRIAQDAARGRVVYNVNELMVNPQDPNRRKTVDLALGGPADPSVAALPLGQIAQADVAAVWLAVEAKSTMTEHIKSKPRLYDELNSSHTIVHAAYPSALATGLVVVNIARTYHSPTRQVGPNAALRVTEHHVPHCAEELIRHVGKLPMAEGPGAYGFDALAAIVVDCDNIGPATLYTAPPAPQPGDRLHYETFLGMVCDGYAERYGG
jgi:hypothetical protein